MSTPALIPSAALEHAATVAASYAEQSLAAGTLRAYRADWRAFQEWCRAVGAEPAPASPITIASFLASMAESHARATINRRLAAIGHFHRLGGFNFSTAHPAIRHTMRGIFRAHGKPQRKAAALGRREVVALLEACDDGTLAGCRDRAMILLGFAGALRRSELAAIERHHLKIDAEGLRLTIPRAKTDQEGVGAELGIPRGRRAETCPVASLVAWLEKSDCKDGPVFRKVGRGDRLWSQALRPLGVWQILVKRAALVGMTVEPGESLSPHGLRAGFVTDSYRAGALDEEIMSHSRHKDYRTMHGYIRRAKLLTESPVRRLGL